jgi:hypothetical protein
MGLERTHIGGGGEPAAVVHEPAVQEHDARAPAAGRGVRRGDAGAR